MNLQELEAEVSAALEPAFRAQLLARGQARSMIWRNGNLPAGAPQFAETLSYDLMAYGDALLVQAMQIRREGGDEQLARRAFLQAGEAIEAVVANGVPDDPYRGFLRVLSAAAFHLGRASARAYSMLRTSLDNANLSRLERSLALLILRSLDQLEDEIAVWRASAVATDGHLVDVLESQELQVDSADLDGTFDESILLALDAALCDQFYSGLSNFLFALQIGEDALVDRARELLRTGLDASADANMVPQWWCFRLTMDLLDDLWQASLHQLLPQTLPNGESVTWEEMRGLFIASLYRRRRAEIDLWPSQIEGAHRSADSADNLVVALPTSAGKTRIAELCILRCLSAEQRVVFVTPLRALSAQTESTLQRTFAPLGKSVSALYGSLGTSAFEEDTLRARDIVVATPEKLDFALRNDPSILDDVGLIVLDEGHMIGLGEREVRYEVQIQRLLNRADAAKRRIVCLSAVFPDGEQSDDFVRWIRRDRDGEAIRAEWRPTRLRFGEVLWSNKRARLQLRVGDERPYLPTFFTEKPPLSGKRKQMFPRDQRELVIATTWRLLEDGESVLIYCPERRSVGPYAEAIIDLASKGFILPVLDEDKAVLANALAIGEEWLGSEHPILKCLELGVAIHHGALPTPFRKEMERLLRDGVLKVTVSSPTLAQGLNLAATSVVMHAIEHFRDGERRTIEASDFKNIIGRAGRAFVDVEGLALFPIFSRHSVLQRKWNDLIDKTADEELGSGLLRLVRLFLARLYTALGKPNIDELMDYVLNNTAAWEFPTATGEDEVKRELAASQWRRFLPVLDTALLSLVGEEEVPVDELSMRLDQLLSSSLWQRQIARFEEKTRALFQATLEGRAKAIWAQSTSSQRLGYFLAGVGLTSGQALDALAPELNPLLIEANGAINEGHQDEAVDAILGLAERLFSIEPFVPDPFPEDWRFVLQLWLKGMPIAGGVDVDDDLLRFVENGLVYKLPWAIDAVRVRARANEDIFDADDVVLTIDDFETGLVVPCIGTGTLNPSAARLIQAGFTSRMAAIKAVNDTNVAFTNTKQLKEWIESANVQALSRNEYWPTPESHHLWLAFLDQYAPVEESVWSVQTGEYSVIWHRREVPETGAILRLRFKESGDGLVLSSAFEELGILNIHLDHRPKGLFDARVTERGTVRFLYRGPKDI